MKKYKVIYADPPWKYERNKVQGAAENHYSTMSIDELCSLPVANLTDNVAFYSCGQPSLNFRKHYNLLKHGASNIRLLPLFG